MNIIRRWLGSDASDDPVPAWASFFTEEQFRSFLEQLEQDLEDRHLPYALEAETGTLEIELPGADRQQLHLLTLARACYQMPLPGWAEYVEQHLDAAISVLAGGMAAVDRLASDFDRARPLLRLRLYPDDYLDPEVPLVYRRLAEGLTAVLVYDLPQSIATVPPDHLAEWNRLPEELFEIALRNVWEQGKLEHASLDLSEGATLELLTDYRNPFAATHVLCLPEYFAAVPQAGILVSVPERGRVILHRIEGMAVMAALNVLLRSVPEVFLEAQHPLCPNVYWWRAGTFTLLPALSEDGRIEFRPPAEFMNMLGALGE
jgi:hypothetical protein